jgi:hypothetical protein
MIPASGNRLKMEAVFRPEFFGFFSGDFPAGSRGNALENGRNSPEKLRRLSGRNIASMFH